jgi:hypothetical protein
MLARTVLQMFMPKRYQQLDIDLSRLALFARRDWTVDKVVWMDSGSKIREIEPWALAQANQGLEDPEAVNVRVGPSSIDGAGEGIFCVKGAAAGKLLCVHPGTVHLASAVRQASEIGQGKLYERIFMNDLPHCVQLFDGTVIDAGKDSEGEWEKHPFAVGHKCNHPPKGFPPNVIKCPFWWNPHPKVNVIFAGFPEDAIKKSSLSDEETDEEEQKARESTSKQSLADRFGLVEKIRTELGFKTSDASKGVIRGLGFVSTRDIEPGEELFVNYRYNPKVPAPAWYHPVDVKEDEQRWS